MHETSFAFTRRIAAALEPWDGAVPSDWRQGLPRLEGRLVTLRELEPGDGPHLLAVLATPEVMRFLSPPPQSLERFTGFIETTRSCGTEVLSIWTFDFVSLPFTSVFVLMSASP